MASETSDPHGRSGRTFPKASLCLARASRFLDRQVPQPIRFLGVGTIGLFVDLAVFTAIPAHVDHPLIVRIGALVVATFVTWCLNRLMTFDASGRAKHAEAARYAVITALAQGTSYAIFSLLVINLLASLPQAATVIGAAAGAVVSYNGHRLFAFAPIGA